VSSGLAAEYWLSPICDAITVHVPVAKNVIVSDALGPEIEQTVPAPPRIASVGAKPLDAVAVIA